MIKFYSNSMIQTDMCRVHYCTSMLKLTSSWVSLFFV